MATISRQEYNNLFGPTTGDKIRLGDTDLYVEIEKDLREYGDEVVYGGGKTIRDGMGLANTMTSQEGSLDLVITNVTIIDPVLGVVKADVGVKDGKIAGIGKAGTQPLRQGLAELCESAGVINELWPGDPLAHSHWRRCNQQDLVSVQGNAREKTLQPLGGLLRASSLEQVVGSQHDDQQIGISRKVRGR